MIYCPYWILIRIVTMLSHHTAHLDENSSVLLSNAFALGYDI